MAMKRADGAKYKISSFRAELKDVARHIKPLPRKFINKAGNAVTKAFTDYALPLVGELPRIGKLI